MMPWKERPGYNLVHRIRKSTEHVVRVFPATQVGAIAGRSSSCASRPWGAPAVPAPKQLQTAFRTTRFASQDIKKQIAWVLVNLASDNIGSRVRARETRVLVRPACT